MIRAVESVPKTACFDGTNTSRAARVGELIPRSCYLPPVRLIGIVPVPSDPSLASLAYGGMLGEDWEVTAYNAVADIPDDEA